MDSAVLVPESGVEVVAAANRLLRREALRSSMICMFSKETMKQSRGWRIEILLSDLPVGPSAKPNHRRCSRQGHVTVYQR